MSAIYTKSGDKSQDEKILMPYTYILQVPGKQIRTKLISAFNYWLKISEDKIKAVGEIVQMLHNSSLLIDDIQDNSILRRGIPVAHSIYGVASTINAGNYAMIIALEKTLELGHPLATTVYTEQLLELHRGQGMEIYWRDNFRCPSEEEYKEMTIKKTGGLFMLAIRLMQLFSEKKSDFGKLSAILGLYFQIRDDYCNLAASEEAGEHACKTRPQKDKECDEEGLIKVEKKKKKPFIHNHRGTAPYKLGQLMRDEVPSTLLYVSRVHWSTMVEDVGDYIKEKTSFILRVERLEPRHKYTENKSYCEDLTEGKFSFPVIHAIRNQDGDNQVLHILRQRTRDVEVKRYCITLLEKLGSFQYTRDTLNKLDQEARAEIARLGGNPLLETLLDELLSWRRAGKYKDLDENTV